MSGSIDPNYDPNNPDSTGENREYGLNYTGDKDLKHGIEGNDRLYVSDDYYVDGDRTKPYKGPHSSYDLFKQFVIFGTDYPEPCTYTAQAEPAEHVPSPSLTIYYYTPNEQPVTVDGTTYHTYAYKGSTSWSYSTTEPTPRDWTSSYRIEASTGCHTYRYYDEATDTYFTEYCWGALGTLKLYIPNSVLRANVIDGNFFGFPHYPDIGVAPEYDGSVWTLDGNFWGFPYIKTSKVAPEYDGSVWTMDSNFWGFPYIKNSGVAPPYQRGFSDLYLGAKNVKNSHLGRMPVKRVYRGKELVFEKG